MITLSKLMHCDGCTDRITYQRNIALLAVGKAAVDLVTTAVIPGIDPGRIAMAWLNPFTLVSPWIEGIMPLMVCLTTLVFFSGLTWNTVHRARHTGLSHWLGLVAAVPFVGLPAAVVLSLVPGRKRTVWDIVG